LQIKLLGGPKFASRPGTQAQGFDLLFDLDLAVESAMASGAASSTRGASQLATDASSTRGSSRPPSGAPLGEITVGHRATGASSTRGASQPATGASSTRGVFSASERRSSGQPCMATGTTDVQTLFQAQGRGFVHDHGKVRSACLSQFHLRGTSQPTDKTVERLGAA